MQQTTYLAKRDSGKRIRVAIVEVSPQFGNYVISRSTGLIDGKRTEQPNIVITEGKTRRTIEEQADLQYQAIVKEYKDKGYKVFPDDPKYIKNIEELVPTINTDQYGVKKHMNAKPFDKVKEASITKVGNWYASRKIDGLRCSLYYDGKEIKSASRGGEHYDYALTHLTKNPKLISFFKNNPDIILDGELYKHGKTLQQISGAARLKKNAYDCEWLEFYLFDVMVDDIPFTKRLEILNNIAEELNLAYDPYQHWEEDDLQMQIVPHELVNGIHSIKELHNKYVEEGWEGLILRNPSKEYGYGKRNSDMIKMKVYSDNEFEVIGYKEGLRGIEDMVFICVTPQGNEFSAKPMGDLKQKEYYVENFESEFKNKKATVKYFYYSNGGDEKTGVPLQPCLKAFRDEKDT